MKIRLGYVAIALNLGKVTSSSTLTYSRYTKINSKDERLKKLKEVTYSNIKALETILNYNIENNIHFYRITSNLIPLATHPDVLWDYKKYFSKDLKYIGNIIKDNHMRVDFHPDQFNVINSLRDDVVKNTLRNLEFQAGLFHSLDYSEGKLVIHTGSGQGGKEKSIDKFINNLKIFPEDIRNKLIIENDDKVFTAKDVLDLCKRANLPMVLDVHHHDCKNDGEQLGDVLEDVFNTWKNESLPPKIHFSSPREFEKDKKHADYIDVERFAQFLDLAKIKADRDFDVMIEAKQKDLALFKLVKDLKQIRPKYKYIDETTIEI
ncbi:UV DNA damage repair endonuclease UvsE [Romboutsia weinsteinii]|uniref:UV DNA damage repair endonuclease UvsE n=1 Tax=Romboutsia weinsteinii TaxID=2020949 RepID=A0A371J863_9FIRM|nr:UV DNA damage repair endonuclease UvsE [Romboutsia weinsteinii]RDY28970.1 UV DNA damage repair endonuclease UvsE [Romboutsia weinsteinii]